MNVYNSGVEKFRDKEFPYLQRNTYLDHGGTTIPAISLSEALTLDFAQNLYGNPHSNSTPSRLSTTRVDEVRENILLFFHAHPKKFDIIFTANATAAIKMVGECFHDYTHHLSSNKRRGCFLTGLFGKTKASRSFWYGHHRDAHTSLVGLREYADGKHRCFTSNEEVVEWITSESDKDPTQPKLFAFPGQSNMTGRRLPMSWPRLLRKSKKNAFTLLDAAALATCSQLELDRDEPDFTAVSFYKIFGMPDFGALIVRKEAAHMLQKRRFFGGGTVGMVISLDATWHAKKTDSPLHDQLEDGTLPFHSIIALDHAMEIHKRLFKSMTRISSHTCWLGRYAYNSMMSMVHGNGEPVFQIYKDAEAIYGDGSTQGATVSFNVLRHDGSLVPYADVEEAADKEGVYVRSGGLCNPGGIATYLGWSEADMIEAYSRGHRCNKPILQVEGRATGVVRVSMGAMTTRQDVEAFLYFIYRTYVRRKPGVNRMSDKLEEKSTMPVTACVHVPHDGSDNDNGDLVFRGKGLPVRGSWVQKVAMLSPTTASVS